MFVNASGPHPNPSRVTRGAAILYSRHGITITVDHLVVADRRYPVAQLTDLRTTDSASDGVGLRVVQVAMLVLAGLTAGLAASGAAGGHTAALIFGAVVAAVAAVPLGFAVARRRRHGHQLWGRHRGVDLLLYATADAREFGQVTRAVRRAREVAVRDAVLSKQALLKAAPSEAALRHRIGRGRPESTPVISSPPAPEPPPAALP